MMPFLGFLIAGIVMLVIRFQSDSSFLNFNNVWAAYDLFAIILTFVGFIGVAVRVFLIYSLVKAKRRIGKKEV